MTMPVASVKDQELFLKAAEARYAELGIPPEQAIQLFDAQFQKLAAATSTEMLKDYFAKQAACGKPHGKKDKKKTYTKKEAAEIIARIKEAALKRFDELGIPRKQAQAMMNIGNGGTNVAGAPAGPVANGKANGPGVLATGTGGNQAKTPTPGATDMTVQTGGGTPKAPQQPTATGATATGAGSFQPTQMPHPTGKTASSGGTITITADGSVKIDGNATLAGPVTAGGFVIDKAEPDNKQASHTADKYDPEKGLTPAQKRAYDMMAEVIKHANERNIK